MAATNNPPKVASSVQDATLLLLVRIDRLLAEADQVRTLRDLMLDAARASPLSVSDDRKAVASC